jgi:hypothetical protein
MTMLSRNRTSCQGSQHLLFAPHTPQTATGCTITLRLRSSSAPIWCYSPTQLVLAIELLTAIAATSYFCDKHGQPQLWRFANVASLRFPLRANLKCEPYNNALSRYYLSNVVFGCVRDITALIVQKRFCLLCLAHPRRDSTYMKLLQPIIFLYIAFKNWSAIMFSLSHVQVLGRK